MSIAIQKVFLIYSFTIKFLIKIQMKKLYFLWTSRTKRITGSWNVTKELQEIKWFIRMGPIGWLMAHLPYILFTVGKGTSHYTYCMHFVHLWAMILSTLICQVDMNNDELLFVSRYLLITHVPYWPEHLSFLYAILMLVTWCIIFFNFLKPFIELYHIVVE